MLAFFAPCSPVLLIFLTKYPSLKTLTLKCTLFAPWLQRVHHTCINPYTTKITSCYVRFCQSACEWNISPICHVLACCGSLFKTRPLKELLAVFGGKSSGLVIQGEFGVCAVSAVCVWMAQFFFFYTRTSRLTLLKFSRRWETASLALYSTVILHVCHSLALFLHCTHYFFRCCSFSS